MRTNTVTTFGAITIPTKELKSVFRIAVPSKPQVKTTTVSFAFGFSSDFCAVVKNVVYSKKFNSRFAAANTYATVLLNDFNSQLVLPLQAISRKAFLTWLSPSRVFSSCHSKHSLRLYLSALSAFYLSTVLPYLRRTLQIDSHTQSASTDEASFIEFRLMKHRSMEDFPAFRTALLSNFWRGGLMVVCQFN